MENPKEYIWYACYGSNIHKERFQHYIDGNKQLICNHFLKAWRGCTDKNLSKEDRPYVFKHNIYFANKSRSWGNKGVAFIDLKNPGFAYGRIYLITKEQFSEIRCQEGRSLNWYGFPQNDFTEPIDNIDGCDVYTFTQANNKTKRNPPSDDYKCIIIEGLKQIGLTEAQAKEYILKCLNQ